VRSSVELLIQYLSSKPQPKGLAQAQNFRSLLSLGPPQALTMNGFRACIMSLTQQLKGIVDGIAMDKPLVNASVEQQVKRMASCTAIFAVVVSKKSSRNCIPQASIHNVCQEIASLG
jgi:hypothetical protein